ncbi:MAG: hypothetical protein SV186_05245 [Candidatus Nanohaloarchaea archaeon]|nr:hypothetical protein [Candidatus Nanohaloarchaea archaeon]
MSCTSLDSSLDRGSRAVKLADGAQVVSGVSEHGGAERVAESLHHRLETPVFTLLKEIESDSFIEIGTETEKEEVKKLGLTTLDA